MNKYRITVVELTTYERVVEAKSMKAIQKKLDNWEYDDFEVNHTHIVGADLQNIYIEEVNK